MVQEDSGEMIIKAIWCRMHII